MNPSQFWAKSKYHLKKRMLEARFGLGMGRSLLKPQPGNRIMVYHGIDQTGRIDLNSRFISKHRFRQEMKWMAQNAQVISVKDFFAGKYAPDQFTVALTFDDGYRNNWKYVIPVLRELNLPATFFISTPLSRGQNYLWPDALDLTAFSKSDPWEIQGIKWVKKRGEYVNPSDGSRLKTVAVHGGLEWRKAIEEACGTDFQQDPAWEDYWKMMNEDEIRSISDDPLFEIGAHSVLHDNYATMSNTEVLADMRESKNWLENVTQQPVTSIAWPFGIYTPEITNLAEQAGFKRILALHLNFGEPEAKDYRAIGRFGNNPHISFEHQISCIIKGKY